MLTTVQQVTVRGERRGRDGYDWAWINRPRDRRIGRKRAMTWFARCPTRSLNRKKVRRSNKLVADEKGKQFHRAGTERIWRSVDNRKITTKPLIKKLYVVSLF